MQVRYLPWLLVKFGPFYLWFCISISLVILWCSFSRQDLPEMSRRTRTHTHTHTHTHTRHPTPAIMCEGRPRILLKQTGEKLPFSGGPLVGHCFRWEWGTTSLSQGKAGKWESYPDIALYPHLSLLSIPRQAAKPLLSWSGHLELCKQSLR